MHRPPALLFASLYEIRAQVTPGTIAYHPGMRRRLIGWAAVLVCLGFTVSEAALLNVRIRDYDEGVYWQSIRAMARGEPLFSSVFASQPSGFYDLLLPFYLVGRSLASLRLTVLLLGIGGLVGTYVAARLIAGRVGGLIALVLVASSPLYFHQSAIIQADGPSVALSVIALCLALLAVRTDGRQGVLLAVGAGALLAAAVGIKFPAAVTVVPVAMVLLSRGRERWGLLAGAAAGGVVGLVIVMLPAIAAPGAAFNELIIGHIRAGQASQQGLSASINLLLLHREEPLEALALIGLVVAVIRQNRAAVMPVIWGATSIGAVLVYHPLFPHHLVMLSIPLALIAAVGLSPQPAVPQRGREIPGMKTMPAVIVGAFVLATVGAGAAAIASEARSTLVPDLHDMEMAAAVAAVSRPGDFWISDNPFAVALAKRDLPGPMVDTARQRALAGLLTVNDLEAARVHYHVRWVLEDSFRLDQVPNYRAWLDAHFHPAQDLGGRAVIYKAD